MLIDQLPPDSHLASLSQTLPDGVLEPEDLLVVVFLVPTRMTSLFGLLSSLDLILTRLTILPLCRTSSQVIARTPRTP